MSDYFVYFSYFAAALVAWFLVGLFYYRFILKAGSITSATYPNGMALSSLSGDTGTSFVYKEIFADKAYFKHGISLDGIQNPVVVDAGVNIGFFSLFIAANFPTAKVFGAEPVPVLHEIAMRNTAAYRDRVKLFRGGLGKAASSAAFKFDPGFSAGSSMFAHDISEGLRVAGIPNVLKAAMHDLGLVGYMPKPCAEALVWILGVPFLNYVFLVVALPLIILFIVFQLGKPGKTDVQCDIITIPEMLKKETGSATPVVDFLKIDVEGAEWDVLLGISDELWSNIQQIIVEVHNLEGGTRLDAVKTLLRSKGFDSVVQDEEEFEIHKILDMGTVFATRNRNTTTGKKDSGSKGAKDERRSTTPRKTRKEE